jgi:phosphorylcholine metabolism protein LicD
MQEKYLKPLKKIVEITEGKCFLLYGTLLGAVRDKKFIPWDNDVDLGILEEDWKDEYLKALKDNFTVKAYKWVSDEVVDKSKIGKIAHLSIQCPHHICFDIFTKGKGGYRYYSAKDEKLIIRFPEKFVKPLKTIDFYDIKVQIPENTEEFLEWNYGDWKTPDKKRPIRKNQPRCYKDEI